MRHNACFQNAKDRASIRRASPSGRSLMHQLVLRRQQSVRGLRREGSRRLSGQPCPQNLVVRTAECHQKRKSLRTYEDAPAQVAPLAGAWIETRRGQCDRDESGVAPLAGAWIETLFVAIRRAPHVMGLPSWWGRMGLHVGTGHVRRTL